MTTDFDYDYDGLVYGRLITQGRIRSGKHGREVLCLCMCSNEKWIRLDLLIDNKTRSCGCLARDTARDTMRLKREPAMLYDGGIDF